MVYLFYKNNVIVHGMTREDVDEETGRGTVVLRITLPKTMKATPTTMVNIIRGVRGVSLSNVVLMDGRDVRVFRR